MRIVHDRDPPFRAVVVLVAEPERVTDLVRSELPEARDRRLRENGRGLGACLVRREQAFGDQIVLSIAQRSQRHGGLDDFTRAGIGDGRARAIHPRVDRLHPLIVFMPGCPSDPPLRAAARREKHCDSPPP